MFLVYGSVVIQPMSNILIDVTPVMSDDGMDMLYQQLKFRGVGVIHSKWTASNYRGPAFPGLPVGVNIPNAMDPNTSGDPMPVSINALRQALKRPRQLLTYIQGNQIVFQSPITANVPDANGNITQKTAACDAAGGPFPRHMRVYQITGVKTAWVEYEIDTYLSDPQTVVVSNRWYSTHDIDENFYTVRTIRGRAVMRLDWANLLSIYSVDQFRQQLLLPTAGGFKRERISVTEGSDGRTLDWEVVDRQQTVNLGSDGAGIGITSVDGYFTTGSVTPVNFKQTVGQIVNIATSDASSVASAFGNLLKSHTPEPRATAILVVKGRPGADRTRLFNFAKGLVMDRFAPLVQNGKFYIVSAFLTQRVGNDAAPEVEFRSELYMGVKATLQVWKGPWSSLPDMQDMSNIWQVGGFQYQDQTDTGLITVPGGPFATAPQPGPTPQNTNYGSYTGMLLSAALGTDTAAPVYVPPGDLNYQNKNIQ